MAGQIADGGVPVDQRFAFNLGPLNATLPSSTTALLCHREALTLAGPQSPRKPTAGKGPEGGQRKVITQKLIEIDTTTSNQNCVPLSSSFSVGPLRALALFAIIGALLGTRLLLPNDGGPS